ncbi:Protein unc-13-like protein, partial [Cucurbita argyrosperma subsp. sororia]
MGHSHNVRRESLSGHMSVARPDYHVDVYENDLVWPFNKLDGIDRDDIRATAYEIFFTACRSSPGFGGRNALAFYSSSNLDNSDGTSSPKPKGVVMTPTGRIKRALGLKMLKRSPSRRMSTGGNCGSNPPSPSSHGNSGASPGLSNTLPSMRPRRPMTSAEIMRQQMKVTEQSDNRLRKTLMRTLVGQVGRRAETIILPLELLRHLKPSEFTDVNEYHFWQRRQLKILEAGLLLHPSIPLDKSNTFAMRLREIIRASESKPIDTGKNSDTMRTLCNSVVSLSWRSVNGTPTDVCHWADGFPLNIHIYVSLLQTIFDIRDETSVLDEVDELLELMKKTWSTLGITRPIHNVCFAWALFEQYVVTAQLEPDLLCAAHTMLAEVANDAKKPDREAMYVKLLTSVLTSMQTWAEKRLLHYHDYFQRGTVGQVENLLPLALSASKILGEDVTITEGAGQDRGDVLVVDSSDGGKAIVREMVPFEVDSIILNLLKSWVDERLKKQRDCLSRSKESETWNPRSKTEPYAQSAVELMKLAKETVEEFFEIPIGVTEELVREIAAGLEHSFQDYITFVSSCGSKQSYIPQLPPLTRCNRDSKFAKLWKRATPCSVVGEETTHHLGSQEGNQTRASTSRGTQRLYIRLNTLHYMLSHLHSLNKILSLSPKVTASTGLRFNSSKSYRNSSYFELSNRSIESACQHVSEVAAFRLIFLDSSSVFYDTLYTNDVANARIQPGLRVLKQNDHRTLEPSRSEHHLTCFMPPE